MKLAGLTALVTGGSRGIGRAIALAFADEGADVAFAHLDDPEADATAAEIARKGRRVMARSVDVCDVGAFCGLIEEIEDRFGTPDILVNNAGGPLPGRFEALTETLCDRQIDLNLKSTILASRAVYPAMVARGSGRIINMSSQLALRGGEGMVVYAAAKAGIIGFTRALAHEASRHGILVNAIAPGPIDTPALQSMPEDVNDALRNRLLLRRFGTADEVAATAVLLAGPGGGFYVGACLSPNGGDVMY